jgi:NADPH-dependent curcumin reductase CurA
MKSREVHLIERPQGLPTPEQFRIVETEVADPADGQLLVENIYMSVDPCHAPTARGRNGAQRTHDRRHDRARDQVA